MEIRERLGRNVRRLIAQKGLTVRGFARDYGISIASLMRILGGTGNPTLLQLQKLARALNVTISRLIGE